MTYQTLIFHRTHEEEQGTNSMIKSINLMTNQNLVDLLHVDYGHFKQCMVDLTIPYICICTYTLKGVRTLSFNKARKYRRVQCGLTP
jgi:hypothetical protein